MDNDLMQQPQTARETLGRQAGAASAGGPEINNALRIVLVVAFAALALASFFLLAGWASDPQTHAGTIETLDAKKDTVSQLVGASTGTSAAISLLPGDAGTPIAEKLVDLSSDFLIVIAAIYLEKYLLTILGFVTFRILIPVSCVLFICAVLLFDKLPVGITLARLAAKLGLLGIAIYLVVPASVFVSSMIEGTYEASITETIATAQQTQTDIEGTAQDTGASDSNALVEFLQSIPNGVSGLTESAKNSLNNFIEALAVMIVTSCVIPILVLLFFLWLVKVILGINVGVPTQMLMPKRLRHWS